LMTIKQQLKVALAIQCTFTHAIHTDEIQTNIKNVPMSYVCRSSAWHLVTGDQVTGDQIDARVYFLAT
jgi:hypothetical protein